MNLDYLHEFSILSKTQSYSKACELLYMNQSTLSKHIKSLESELDVILFDRNTRNVTLTEYGIQLLPYAEKISELGYKYQNELAQKKNNVLSIGAIPSMSVYGIVDILLDFNKMYPEITVNINEADSLNLKKNLLEKEYELTFMRIFDSPLFENPGDDSIATLPYYHDYMVAVIPKKHHLYGETELTIPQLANEQLCLIHKNKLRWTIL